LLDQAQKQATTTGGYFSSCPAFAPQGTRQTALHHIQVYLDLWHNMSDTMEMSLDCLPPKVLRGVALHVRIPQPLIPVYLIYAVDQAERSCQLLLGIQSCKSDATPLLYETLEVRCRDGVNPRCRDLRPFSSLKLPSGFVPSLSYTKQFRMVSPMGSKYAHRCCSRNRPDDADVKNVERP
jgi:hypothetical protein